MRGSRLLIGLLVLATVLFDCVVVTAGGRQAHFPHPTLILAWALQLSQVSLMAVWLALGKTSGPLRLMAVVVVMALWSWGLGGLPHAADPEEWAVLLIAQTMAVSAPLLVARSLSLGLVDESFLSDAEDSATGMERWQFSIAYLLGWMTVLAVMLGTLQWLAPYDSLPFGLVAELPFVVFLVGRAAVALAASWTILGTRRLAIRIVAICVVVAMAVITLSLAAPGFAGGFLYLLGLVSLEALLLVALLAVFRTAGYRLKLMRRRSPVVQSSV